MGNGTQPSKLKNQVSDNCPEAQCSEVQCRRFGLGVIPTPRLPDDAHSARPCVKSSAPGCRCTAMAGRCSPRHGQQNQAACHEMR